MLYFIIVYFSNFRGSKHKGSMDPVHEGGPWTRDPCFALFHVGPLAGLRVLLAHYTLPPLLHVSDHYSRKIDYLPCNIQ